MPVKTFIRKQIRLSGIVEYCKLHMHIRISIEEMATLKDTMTNGPVLKRTAQNKQNNKTYM